MPLPPRERIKPSPTNSGRRPIATPSSVKFAVIPDGRPDGSTETVQHELPVPAVVFDFAGHHPMPVPGISLQACKVVNKLGT